MDEKMPVEIKMPLNQREEKTTGIARVNEKKKTNKKQTREDSADHGRYKRRPGPFVDFRQEAEQQAVAGHGVQNARYREQTS